MIYCLLCTKKFQNRSMLETHMVIHTNERPHKCLMCSAAFGQARDLKIHVKHVHESVKKVYRTKDCPLCGHKIQSRNLSRHLRTHSAELPLSCSIFGCHFKTKHQKTLEQHLRGDHPDERPYRCPQQGCHYRSNCKKHLRDHLKAHSGEKPLLCKVPGCNYSCNYKSTLGAHAKRVHGSDKKFKCTSCDFRTNYKSSLKLHQDSHGNREQFKCQSPNCGYASHDKYRVTLHFESKHKKKNVKCTALGCNHRCGSRAILRIHLKQHELRTLKCPSDSCNFSTKFKRCLLKHVSRFHQSFHSAPALGTRELDIEVAGTAERMEKISCRFPNCGYQTRIPHDYDRHKITHDTRKKRRHVCTFCFARFSLLHSLKDHIQRHIGEKPFRCSLCKYTAATSVQLSRHARRTHHIHVLPRGKDNEMRKCCTCDEIFWSCKEFVLHSMTHLRAVVVLKQINVQRM